ncbi:pentatricopeptide repeat-containing protein At5g65560-like [Aristolochia californica]|uniref:pentatricopeptide repeat-containing protein At5g65560-like n=1 Tax=Aristolochia californica TaxID=171875 RepID=UPI0035E30F65
MVDKGIGPMASTYTLPLTSLCEAGRLKEACDLLIDMRKRCVCPNVQTHTGLIPGLFRVDCFKISIGLFNKMLQDSVVTLINGYCKLGNLNNAMRLLNFMQENGCEPDEWTFTELICGFLKRGTLDVVLDMFNKMAACGLNPKKVSYTALIHGCCKREAIGLALSLLDKIKEISCRPKVHTYNVLFNGFCTQNRLPEAEKLCTKIAAQGLFPTVGTYTTLIDGLCKSGATSLAFKVVDEMMKHNCLPNHHTYSTLIYGLCQEVNAMEVELLFKEMQRKGLIPDRVTNTSVIDGPYGVLLNGLQKDQDVLEKTTLMAIFPQERREMEGLAGQTKYTAEQLGIGTALQQQQSQVQLWSMDRNTTSGA